MSGIRIDEAATKALLAAMDGLSLRQSVINNNLANVNTPGFKASDVSFAGYLQASLSQETRVKLESTAEGHMQPAGSAVTSQVIVRNDTTQRLDGNNVDLEKEMVYLTETVIHYQAVTRLMSRRLAMLRTVINEGRK